MHSSLSPNVLLLAAAATLVWAVAFTPTTVNGDYTPVANPDAGLVRHGVFFRYTDETTPQDKQNIILRYTQLMNLCVRPSDGQPYIVSFDAGFNNSKEGWDQQMEHGFVVTFSSVDDRNYFVGRPFQQDYDPYHDAFKAFVGPYLRTPIATGLVVMDFSTAPLFEAPFPDSPATMQNSSLTMTRPPVLIPTNPLAGYVRHFVTFRFADTVTEEQRQSVVVNYTSLALRCVRPGTNQLYIVSMDGGPANSKEGFDQQMDQLYIITFYNESDKNYFVGRPFQQDFDPLHDAFKAFVGPFLRQPIATGLFVFDFVIQPTLPVPGFALNNPNAGLVRHSVEFRYVDGTTHAQRMEVVTRFAALANLCVRPNSTDLYIVSWDHGRNNSKEGFDQLMMDSFILTFSSVADRDYFVGRPFQSLYDPHHDAFKTFVGPFLRQPIATGLVVMDFSVAPVLGAYPFPTLSSQANSSLIVRDSSAVQTVSPNAGVVHHIVTFRFADSVTADQKRSVITNYTSLFLKCVRPGTNQPYILGFDGGVPNSKEGFDQLMEQLFLMTFANISDKNYFVGRPFQQDYDPYHDAFKAFVGPFLRTPIATGLFVFDFTTSAMPLPPIVYNPNAGLVHHFVSFHYIDGLTADQHQLIVDEYLSLMNKCVRPSDGSLYIQSFDYGLNNSKEGFDQRYKDGFLLTFSSIEDRDYFVGRPFQQNYDPYHDAFKAFIGPYIHAPVNGSNIVVMDWSVAPMQGLPFPPPPLYPNATHDTALMRVNQNMTTNPNVGLVRHVVIFRFADFVTPQQKDSVVVNYTSLKTKCVNPVTYQPYIVSFDAGLANSKEGFDQHMEQLFVVTFQNEADRDYFVGRPFQQQYDPYHDAFKAFVGPFLRTPIETGLFVFDFTVGNTPYPLPPNPVPPAPTAMPTAPPATATPTAPPPTATGMPTPAPATVMPTGSETAGSTGGAVEGSTGSEPVVVSSTGESPAPGPSDDGGGNHKAVIAGVVVPLVILAVGGAAFWFYRRRSAQQSARAHAADEPGVVYTDLSH